MKRFSVWCFLALVLVQLSVPSAAQDSAGNDYAVSTPQVNSPAVSEPVWSGPADTPGVGEFIQTESLRLQFNAQGDLLRTEACFPECAAGQINSRVLSGEHGMFVFSGTGQNTLNVKRTRDVNSTILEFTDSNDQLTRRWQVPDTGWQISLSVRGTSKARMASGEDFRPQPSSGFGNLLEQSRYLFFENSSVNTIGLDDSDEIGLPSAGWFGFRNRFWAVMVLSETSMPLNAKTGANIEDADLSMQFDASKLQHLALYLGPVEPTALAQTAPELEDLMYAGLWFWLRWICQALYYLLGAIEQVVPSWGLSVMVLSVVVGLLMRPLSQIADRLQNQVQATDARLAPALDEIKKNNKGAEQSEKIIALYKSEGVHPLYSLKSMLGVFVVIPVFIGAFDMLAENIHLSGESFLWIADLSHPDAFMALPFSLPFFGGDLNLLPFIMTGLSFIASKLHSHPDMNLMQQRKQARNLVLMSLGFLVLFYTFPAGMVLYWTTNNLISVIKMAWKRRKVIPA